MDSIFKKCMNIVNDGNINCIKDKIRYYPYLSNIPYEPADLRQTLREHLKNIGEYDSSSLNIFLKTFENCI